MTLRRIMFALALIGLGGPTRAGAQGSSLLLSPGRAGPFQLGQTIDEVYVLVGRDRVRLVDLSAEGMFTPAIEITFADASVHPSVVARFREYPCFQFAIDGIVVKDPRFRTTEGMGVGSTVADLRRAYQVRLNQEEGHSVIVPSLRMTFAIDGASFADSVRTVSVWLWPDPADVRKRRCPNR